MRGLAALVVGAVACGHAARGPSERPAPVENRVEEPVRVVEVKPGEGPVVPQDLDVSVFFATAPARVDESAIPKGLSAEARAVVAVLMHAPKFATGGVGIAAVKPEEVMAAERLAGLRDGVAAFEWLVVNGSAAGRLFGYWGLLALDQRRASKHAGAMLGDQDLVTTMSGCLLGRETVAEVAAEAPQWPRLGARP